MSLTVVYSGKNVKLRRTFRHRHWVPLLIGLIYTIIWSYNEFLLYTQNQAILLNKLSLNQEQYHTYQQSLGSLQEQTEHQLLAFQLQIGELQGQLNKLNAYGEKLAEAAELPMTQLNEVEVGIGGPAMDSNSLPQLDVTQLFLSFSDLKREIENQEHKMQVLESLLMNHQVGEGFEISGRPITSGWLSSYYGLRKDPFTGLPTEHLGVDFAGKRGDDIVSTGSGVVTWAGERYGYGEMVEIDHGNNVATRYAHNSHLNVRVGDVVNKGQVIAKMGSSGRSTGPHVHYEVLRHGKQIDPLKYIYRKKKG